MIYTKEDYDRIHKFAFSDENPGWNPDVIESPNGDGVWDEHKRYAHLAPKYFDQASVSSPSFYTEMYSNGIFQLYHQARNEADRICRHLDIPKEFWSADDSTLRILDYPAGATTAPHTDFDLFTLCLYRDDMDAFKYLSGEDDPLLERAREISPGIHFGELMTELNGAQETEHEVLGTDNRQCSIVFFVVPNHKAILPSGISVGKWMDERKNRSRKIKG